MTLRITIAQDAAGHVVRLHGRLDGEGAAEVERVLASLSGSTRLELTDLRAVDEAGLDALRAIRARGIPLTEMSQYLGLRLDLDPAGATGPPAPGRAPGRSVTRRAGRSGTAHHDRRGTDR